MRIGILIVFILSYFIGYPQEAGALQGNIYNETSGEPLPFATVFIPEIKKGSVTDESGSYSIKLSPGKYSVVF